MTDLGLLDGGKSDDRSQAWAINDAGQIVGQSENATDNTRAFLWQDGEMIDLGVLGGANSHAYGINESGQVVGTSETDVYAQGRAFMWDNGHLTDLGTLGGIWSAGAAINNSGQIVGYSKIPDFTTRAFLWQDGTMTDIDGNSWWSQAYAINNSGRVVVWSPGLGSHLWSLDGSRQFFEGFAPTEHRSGILNDAGQVVGDETQSGNAAIWDNGTVTVLNDLIPADSGWNLSSAVAINDVGQIVGQGEYNGEARAYLLTTSSECPLPPAPIDMTASRTLAAATAQQVSGQVFWNPSVAGASSVPVPGVRVQIGCGVDETTSATGDYSLSAEPGEQTMTASLELFSHSPTGASVTIVETKQVTVPENGGNLPAMTTFGKNMRLTVLGKDTPLLNVHGNQDAFTAEANIPVNIEGTDVPIHVNVSWTKNPDTLKISADTGTFTWQGQTLTVTDFKYESPANTFTFKATGSFVVGGLQLNNVQMTASRDENGVFHFEGSGQVLVQGATIAFESIKAKSGSTTELHVRAKVTLPNQPANSFATFETDITPGGNSLNVSLQNFAFNGGVATAQLHYTSSPQKLSITGTAKSQIGGAQLDAVIDTTIAPGNSSVAAKVTLSLASNGGDPISIQANILWNAATNQLTGTATASFPVTPCPGSSPGAPAPSYTVQVELTISKSSIAISGSASIPLPCSFGANKSMTITVTAANQDLSVNATIPFTVQGMSGDLAAEFKVSDNDMRVMVGVKLNINLSFLNLNLQQGFIEHAAGDMHLQAASSTLRIAVVDPLGKRTGYDPATGNGVNEIPGATWSLDANGLDQISVPGFLGGYRIELYSTIDQTVSVTIQGDNGSTASITAALVANEPYYGQFGLSVGTNGGAEVNAGALQETPEPTSEISVTYTGATHVRATNPGGLLLAATLAEPANGTVGDVREATVRFVNRATGATLCEAVVGLVEQTNPRLGTAACLATGPLGKPGDSLTVGIIVDGAYSHDDAADDRSVALVGTQTGMALITGSLTGTAPAGQLINDGSATLSLTAIATPGVSVLSITAQQGSSRYIIHSLTGASFVRIDNQVILTGKAMIIDTTTPRRQVVVARNALIQLTMTSARSGGNTVSLTIWHPNGGISLATNWDGLRSVEARLTSGSLAIR